MKEILWLEMIMEISNDAFAQERQAAWILKPGFLRCEIVFFNTASNCIDVAMGIFAKEKAYSFREA